MVRVEISYLFIEMKFDAGFHCMRVIGMVHQQRGGTAVVRRKSPADQPIGIQVGNDLKIILCVIPLIANSGFFMYWNQVCQNLFFAGSVGYIGLAALVPLDIFAKGFFEGRKDFDAAQA